MAAPSTSTAIVGGGCICVGIRQRPNRGVTPFSQMCQYVRSNDRRIAAESKGALARENPGGKFLRPALDRRLDGRFTPKQSVAIVAAGHRFRGRIGGMTPDRHATSAASGFGPRALGLLADRSRARLACKRQCREGPPERVVKEEGDRPLVPALRCRSPWSLATSIFPASARLRTSKEIFVFTDSAIPCSAWVHVSFR